MILSPEVNSRLKYIVVCIYMVLMSVQIIGLEGAMYEPRPISLIKVGAMLLAPVLMILLGVRLRDCKRPVLLGGLFIGMMIACCALSGQGISWPRIGYRAMFVMMFVCVWGIVNEGGIKSADIIKLLKWILLAYCITYAIQHFLYLLGIREMHLFNYYFQNNPFGVYKSNGLALEASHSARIMPLLYWGIIKLTEIESGKAIGFVQSWKQFPIITLLFWLTMATMGSAMALISGVVLLLYFLRKSMVLILGGVALFVVLINVDTGLPTVERVQTVFHGVLADNSRDTLIVEEVSGATRIVPMMNMLLIDLADVKTWVGHGNTQVTPEDIHDAEYIKSRFIGDVQSYGLLTYIMSLVFVYGCCIRKFFSMETLFFGVLFLFSVGSVYYTWFMLMLFAMVWYYSDVCETRRAAASGDLAKT